MRDAKERRRGRREKFKRGREILRGRREECERRMRKDEEAGERN